VIDVTDFIETSRGKSLMY